MLRAEFLLAQLLIILSIYIARARAGCYAPDGTYEADDFPCFPDQTNSVCCQPGYACLSNGLCHATPASKDYDPKSNLTFTRRGCTDPTWKSSECPQFCLEYRGGGEGIDYCNIQAGEYCCTFYFPDCECMGTNDVVHLANFTTVTVIPASAKGPTVDPLVSTSTTQQTTTSSSSKIATTSTTTPSSTLSFSSTSVRASTSSSIVSSTSSSSSSTNSQASSSSSSHTVLGAASTLASTSTSTSTATSTPTAAPTTTNVTAVAVGVVVPVVVIALLVAGFLFWRHHQQAKESIGPGLYVGEDKPLSNTRYA